MAENTQYPIGTSKEYIKNVRGLYDYSIGSRNSALFRNPLERRYSNNPNAYSMVDAPNIGEPYIMESTDKKDEITFLDKKGGLVGYTYEDGYLSTNNYKVVSSFEEIEKNQKGLYFSNLNPLSRISKPYYEKHEFRDNIKFLYSTDIEYKPVVFDLSYLDRIYEYYVKDRDLNIYGNHSTYNELNPVRNIVNEYTPEEPYVNNGHNEEMYSTNRANMYVSGDSINGGENGYTEVRYGTDYGNTITYPVSTSGGSSLGESIGIYDEYSRNGSGKINVPSTDDIFDITSERTKGLLNKTNEMFKSGKINSLVSRFHTKAQEKEQIQSAVDGKYGLSRGRNLVKKDNPTNYNGYEDPYCRVWTTSNQYSKFSDLIRPSGYKADEFDKVLGVGYRPRVSLNGPQGTTFSTMQDNGLPTFTPNHDGDNVLKPDSVKRCMFSIENLAWKDIHFDNDIVEFNTGSRKDGAGKVLTPEQIGPNGGRIMWFPPYNLKFNENVGVNWDAKNFIGRGEKMYSYIDTERSGNLEFTILIDHPSILDRMVQSNTKDNNESDQQILRFFAGCEPLEDINIKEDKVETTKTVTKTEEIDTIEWEENFEPLPEREDIQKHLVMYVFFPNDFSGVDYNPRTSVNYLLSGVGYGVNGYEMDTNGNIEGNNGATLEGCIDEEIVTSKNKNGGYNNWEYQPDARVNDEVLGMQDNYRDTTCYGLNTDNLVTYLTNNDTSKGNYKTILEYLKLQDKDKDELRQQIIPFSKINDLKSLFVTEDGFDLLSIAKNIEISCIGFASKHGTVASNRILAKDRATLLRNYLINSLGFDAEWFVVPRTEDFDVPVRGKGINSIEAKLGRRAEIHFDITYDNQPVLDRIKEENIVIQKDGVDGIYANKMVKGKKEITTTEIITTDIGNTYDMEYQYFNTINEKDDLVRRYITDKVKYFDPAFHSITPEGFNARLTFLHQCTRQGPTVGKTEKDGTTAGNLAFGRPPVCVLRIGDFYNTRIIIESISITYDNNGGVQWDMNPEGIGLQPMYANVTIGFKFIGGSDLSGPISRLQNAVSHNFFANTSVYDRRADYRTAWIEKDEIGNNEKIKNNVVQWQADFNTKTDNNR